MVKFLRDGRGDYMGYKEMLYNMEKKFGKDSKEVLKLKLMYISYTYINGKVTFETIEKYYKKMIDKYNDHMI